jgi:hypothetical protein
MRQITKHSVSAFLAGNPMRQANMQVSNYNNEIHLYLHGNLIAKKQDGKLFITASGWMTNTTKERLNGLSNVSIQQKQGNWYLNGKLWDGQWTEVATN